MIPQIGEENVTIGLLNTLSIMEMVDDVTVPFQEPELPHFNTGDISESEYLWSEVWKGFEKRGLDSKPNVGEYKERIEYEMSVITEMGFSGYFLIIADWVKYARENGIQVDLRGSAASSLVNFLLDMTDTDPVEYGLVFERFLNKDRLDYPDADLDCSDQQFIISYLESTYGKQQVCRVVNFSYITPKVAIKDVGDVFDIPYKTRDEVSKLFPSDDFDEDYNNSKARLEKMIQQNPEYQKWFEVARAISGKIRQTSIHACAVGVVNSKITDYMPIHLGENGEKIIQVDKKILEKIGIVKMDILGLKTLSVVARTLELIGKDKSYLDTNDKEFLSNQKAYEIIDSGNTEGIFQMESYGMKELFKRLNCRSILEISDGISLYRPDSMDVLEEYILVKQGKMNPTYIHDDMIPFFKETQGQMVYQEQVLNIVRKFGGRSYGQADIFRRAIGKKDKDLIAKESIKLKDEIVKNGYDTETANKLYDLMASKGGLTK
jgi:DNA polymerase-3 subunit alpha